jgi:hypothetical protein
MDKIKECKANKTKDLIEFDPRLAHCIIFPEYLNLTHIYAYLNLQKPLEYALASGCPLIKTIYGTTALSIAMENHNFVLIETIIKHIKKNPTYDNFSVLNGHLPQLNRMSIP